MSYSVFVEDGAPLMFLGSEKIALLKHVAGSEYNATLRVRALCTWQIQHLRVKNYEYKVITEGTSMVFLSATMMALLFFLEPLSNMMIWPNNSGPGCLWQLILCCLHFWRPENVPRESRSRRESVENKENLQRLWHGQHPSWTEIFVIMRYFYADILLCTGLKITPPHCRQYKHFRFNGPGLLCVCMHACLCERVCTRKRGKEWEVENVLGSCVNRNTKLPQECIFSVKLRASHTCLLQFQAKCKRH